MVYSPVDLVDFHVGKYTVRPMDPMGSLQKSTDMHQIRRRVFPGPKGTPMPPHSGYMAFLRDGSESSLNKVSFLG